MSANVPVRSPSEFVPRISSRFTSEMPRTWFSGSWNLSICSPSESATSSSVALRPRRCSTSPYARSSRRLFWRTLRGTQSSERSWSRIAPLMRNSAYVLNLQVFEIDVGRQAHRDPVHDVPDQRGVLEHDLLLETRRDLRVLLLGLAEQR